MARKTAKRKSRLEDITTRKKGEKITHSHYPPAESYVVRRNPRTKGDFKGRGVIQGMTTRKYKGYTIITHRTHNKATGISKKYITVDRGFVTVARDLPSIAAAKRLIDEKESGHG